MSAYIRCPSCGCDTVDVDNPDDCACDWHTGEPGHALRCSRKEPVSAKCASCAAKSREVEELTALLRASRRALTVLAEKAGARIPEDLDLSAIDAKIGGGA